MPTAAALPRTPFWTRPAGCLLMGVGLALTGAALDLGWLLALDEWAHTGGLSSTPRVLWALALLVLPAIWRIASLCWRKRKREAAYTALSCGLAAVCLAFAAMVFIATAVGRGMPRG